MIGYSRGSAHFYVIASVALCSLRIQSSGKPYPGLPGGKQYLWSWFPKAVLWHICYFCSWLLRLPHNWTFITSTNVTVILTIKLVCEIYLGLLISYLIGLSALLASPTGQQCQYLKLNILFWYLLSFFFLKNTAQKHGCKYAVSVLSLV